MVSFSQSVLSCVAAAIKTIGIVDVAALGKIAPLAGDPHPPPAEF